MSDGVAITAGSGTTIATDDSGAGGHVQIVKLALSADGSATPITADSKGLKVQQATAADLNVTEASAASALTALQLIDDTVFADEAAFTVATSKVSTIGVHAVSCSAAPDSTGADTAVSPVSTRNRVPFYLGGDPGTITVKHTSITTAVTDAAIVTISTGNKIVVTRISVTLDNASTVFPTVLIGFGATNTPTTTGVLYSHGGFPAGGGMTIGDGSGILGIGADNDDLRVTTTGNATGNGLQITVTYHLIVA